MIGSQTFKGVTNVLFKNNYVYGKDLSGNTSGSNNGARVKSDPSCGGLTKQVSYINTCLYNVEHLIIVDGHYDSCNGSSGTPQFENILVNGITSKSSLSGSSTFYGYNASNLAQVYVANTNLDTSEQSSDEYATVYLDNTSEKPSGTDVTTKSFSISGSAPTCNFNSSY